MDILLAHPDRDLLASFKTLLGTRGHKVTTVFDATQVFPALSKDRFDAAAVDMELPRMVGSQVYDNLFERGVVCVALTNGRISRRLLCSRIAANEFLAFPFTADELCAVLEDLVEKKRSGKVLRFGKATVSAADFTLNGKSRLAAKEIDAFEALCSGEGGVRGLSGRYVDSLDRKLLLARSGVRIVYTANEGYKMVETDE